MDGLIRRVAQPIALPAPPAAVAAALPAPAPIAEALPKSTNWLWPATLATVTVGIAAATLTGEASHIRDIRLSSILPRAKTVAHHAAAAKPAVKPSAAATTAAASATAAKTAATQAMQSAVNQAASSAGVSTGIMTIDLKTGAVASSNADTVFTSASIYKLFVANAIFRGIDSGTIKYTDAAGSTGMNVQSCLQAMITVSSNPCGEALAGIVNWDSQNAGFHAAGYTHTLLRQFNSEQTSASDVALLLQRLYNGTLVSPASTTAFINLLKAQQINDRLPVGLPAGVTVAHKTGDLNGLAHDAGIVYAPTGNYIVVGMSGPWKSTGQAYGWFNKFSDSLYSSLTASRVQKVIR